MWKVKNTPGLNLKDFGAPISISCYTYTSKLSFHLRRCYSSSLHVIFVGLWSFFSSVGCQHCGRALNRLLHRRGKLHLPFNGYHFCSWFLISYVCSWSTLEVGNMFRHTDQVGIRFVHTDQVDPYDPFLI